MLAVDVLEITVGRRIIFFSQGILNTIDQSPRADMLRQLRRKTVLVLRVDKEAYVQTIFEWVEHHLWSSDSLTAHRGICALRSSKPFPRCTAIRAEGDGLLTEESEVKAHSAG